MPDTPAPDPSDDGNETTDERPSPTRGTPRRRRALPVGPLGMLLITAVALAAAIGAGAVVQGLLDDDGAVPIQEALDSSSGAAPRVANASARAEVGSLAPDVRLEYLDGEEQQLAEVAGRGTAVVLNFWSSTCIPCLKEMPAFEEVHQRFGDEVRIVGIDVADTEKAGRDMVRRTGVTYDNARDPRSEIFAVYGGIALPRTVLIGADGTVLDTHSGELSAEELTGMLAEHDVVAA